MARKSRLGALACSAAMVTAIASPAFAEGTTAGNTITNVATVNYTIGGITQTAATGTNEFTVDRKINFTVTENGNTTTQVSPNQLQAVTSFIVTNLSNTTIDIGLLATQLAGTTATHGGTDTFDATNVKIYKDVNGNGLLDAGDIQITYLDEVAADGQVNVLIVADIPIGLASGSVAGVVLTGTAKAGGTTGSEGAVLTNTVGGNTAGIDTVLADTGSNGIEAAQDDYTVLAAAISAAKYSRVVWDPINGSTDPKMIPGAQVEYCIAVTNSGGATASNVVVTDPVPAFTTYFPTFGVKVDGTQVSGSTCTAGAGNGSFAGTTVTGPLTDIASGATRTVVFQVTID